MAPLDLPVVQKFFTSVVDPVVQLLFAVAVVYFIYGVFTYIRRSGDSEARTEGANHILWSIVGLFIMVSVWGIITLIKNSIGA